MSDLSKKTVKELREIAKGFNVTGRWDMTKAQLIDSINACDFSDSDILFETDCIVTEEEPAQESKRTTLDFLSSSEVGTLVAFNKPNSEIAFSGKLVSVDKENIIVETKMGTRYTLKPSDIHWVKTGKRWPKWVFEMFNSKKKEDIDDAVSKVGK